MFFVCLGAFRYKVHTKCTLLKYFFLKYLCSCTCGLEWKTQYFGCRTQPLPFWTEEKPLSWWWLDKDLQSADLRAVCLRGKAELAEFSVKGSKAHWWKIHCCKTEIFKIPLLSNRFQFSLVTVLWGETKLNLKKLWTEGKFHSVSVPHCTVFPSPVGNRVLCHSPFCWVSLGPAVNAVFLHFSFYLKYWHTGTVFTWNLGNIGTALRRVKDATLRHCGLSHRKLLDIFQLYLHHWCKSRPLS